MRSRVFKHRSGRFTFSCKEWRCCGNKWQLFLSRRFPERYNWGPVCPNCNKKG